MDKNINRPVQTDILISVVLPVYNGAEYLREAIDSILHQSLTQFEFLIYNDASTDNSTAVIQSYTDERIVFRTMPVQLGLVGVLNEGLKDARGKYIARMDQDDIAHLNRFQEQYQFMEANSSVGICGTWYENFGTFSGEANPPSEDKAIQLSLFYSSPVGHPTVMMRRSMMADYSLQYNNDFLFAEDYELFERASFHFSISNIPKVLLRYRKHATQITNLKWQQQYFLVGKVQARRFLRTLKEVTAADQQWMEAFCTASSVINDQWFENIGVYKKRILQENSIFDAEILQTAVDSIFKEKQQKSIYNFFFEKYYARDKFSIPLLWSFIKEKHQPYKYLGSKLTVAFVAKCLMSRRKKHT
jgi:glycosyltransferase involved in cell wall biosynthesis